MMKLDMLHNFTKNPQESARLGLKESWKIVACCGHGGHGHGSSSRRFGCATPELSPLAFAADLSLQHTVHGVDPDASYAGYIRCLWI